MALEFMYKAFQLNNTTPTNNNQRSSSNPFYNKIAQSGMNIDQDRQILMVDDNVGNQFRQNVHGNGNVVAARVEGNSNGINANPIRCYNCQGKDHYASNCIVKPRKRDDVYLQQELQIAQEEESGIQSTQSDKALVYDSDGSAEYKNYEECKYDKISYDKAYNDMQQKIERLQVQLGDQKGKSKDISCVSNTLDPLSQKLENENVELEFQVRNYEKENAHLKTTYKNLFDSISVTRPQTKTIINSLQTKLHDTIYENAKLRSQLFDKVSKQNDTTRGTSTNTKFAKQSILGKPPSSYRHKLYDVTPLPKSMVFPKVCETHALSKLVTSNSVPTPIESKVVKNDNMITPGIFRINPFKASRGELLVTLETLSVSQMILDTLIDFLSNGFTDLHGNTQRPTNCRFSRSYKGVKVSENKGIVPTEMELVLEQTQQGTSHDVSVSTKGVEELKRIVWIKGEKKEALHTTLGLDNGITTSFQHSQDSRPHAQATKMNA
nr:hypothetical protein [Tanacetum cinerariifolium]GEV54745.1 hypothetical protein [Tanacetum cinerariifolium]